MGGSEEDSSRDWITDKRHELEDAEVSFGHMRSPCDLCVFALSHVRLNRRGPWWLSTYRLTLKRESAHLPICLSLNESATLERV